MTRNPEGLTPQPELPKEIAEIWQGRRLKQQIHDAEKQPTLSKLKSRVLEMDEVQSRGESSLVEIIVLSNQKTAFELLGAIKDENLKNQAVLLEWSETALSEKILEPEEIVGLLKTSPEFDYLESLIEVLDEEEKLWEEELMRRSKMLYFKIHGSEEERREAALVANAGVIIKAIRQGQGISPDVAAAYLGVKPGFIAFLENGLVSLDEVYPKMKDQLAAAIDIDSGLIDLMFEPSTWERKGLEF